LQTGTLEQIAEEMDDTEMVVKQLEKKSRGLDDEIFAMDAEARMAAKFSEKIELEEKGASLKARKDVLNGYLNRARKRLLALQTRYKDLIAYGGASDDYVGNSRSRSSWNDVKDEASTYTERTSSSSSSSSSRGSSSYGASSSYGETSGTSGAEATDSSSSRSDGDSWRSEGFGSSSGRSRRGSGRRRARSRSSRTSAYSEGGVDPNPPRPSPSPSPSPSYSTTPNASSRDTASRRPPPPPPRTTTTPSPSPSTSSSSSAVSKSNYSYDVPPHRRTTGSKSFASRQAEDQKRMQEIKVDEEFEKLKKELGL